MPVHVVSGGDGLRLRRRVHVPVHVGRELGRPGERGGRGVDRHDQPHLGRQLRRRGRDRRGPGPADARRRRRGAQHLHRDTRDNVRRPDLCPCRRDVRIWAGAGHHRRPDPRRGGAHGHGDGDQSGARRHLRHGDAGQPRHPDRYQRRRRTAHAPVAPAARRRHHGRVHHRGHRQRLWIRGATGRVGGHLHADPWLDHRRGGRQWQRAGDRRRRRRRRNRNRGRGRRRRGDADGRACWLGRWRRRRHGRRRVDWSDEYRVGRNRGRGHHHSGRGQSRRR